MHAAPCRDATRARGSSASAPSVGPPVGSGGRRVITAEKAGADHQAGHTESQRPSAHWLTSSDEENSMRHILGARWPGLLRRGERRVEGRAGRFRVASEEVHAHGRATASGSRTRSSKSEGTPGSWRRAASSMKFSMDGHRSRHGGGRGVTVEELGSGHGPWLYHRLPPLAATSAWRPSRQHAGGSRGRASDRLRGWRARRAR
jgi:hypothetical protein